jgi:hypothetical protein
MVSPFLPHVQRLVLITLTGNAPGCLLFTLTNYISTGEVPWLYDMIEKYHETAKKSGAIVSNLFIIKFGICMLVRFEKSELSVTLWRCYIYCYIY